MAMYYYARKLQKGAKVSQPSSKPKTSSSHLHHSKQQMQILPPLPPLLSSYSASSSSSGSNLRPNGLDHVRPPQQQHPPCCSGLVRSRSSYENFDEDDFEDDGDEPQGTDDDKCDASAFKKDDDEIYYEGSIPNGVSTAGTTPPQGTLNYKHLDHLYDKQLKSVEFKGSQLISGSWEALVQLVLPTETHFPQDDFLFAFLLCSRLENPPHLTLNTIFRHFAQRKAEDPHHHTHHHGEVEGCLSGQQSPSDQDICRRCITDSQQQLDEDEEDVENSSAEISTQDVQDEELNLQKDRVHLLVKFLKFWTQLLPHDFRDDRVMHFVRVIAKVSIRVSSQVREDVSGLLANLLKKLSALEAYEASLRRIRTESSIGEPIAAPSVVTICPNPSIMAQQLSLVELQRFSFIGAQEFVAQLVRKERSRRSNVEEGDGSSDTSNLDAFIAWFKRLSMFTASEICKMSKKKSRCRVIEYWIQVGKECLKLRNFNSLMAILSGLSIKPVARLKKTWSKINCADLIELQTAMDPKTNFSAYRTMYKASVWKSIQIPEQEKLNYKILVPYFSLLLRDVYNLNFTYPSVIPTNGHINLEKYNYLAKLIKEIISWQTISCSFTRVQSIFNAVQALPIYTDEELMDASYGCEDPDNAVEKEHFNQLRNRDQHHRLTPLAHNKPPSQFLYHV